MSNEKFTQICIARLVNCCVLTIQPSLSIMSIGLRSFVKRGTSSVLKVKAQKSREVFCDASVIMSASLSSFAFSSQ
eukprot:1383055-Rhodomonas_salina.1